MSAPRMNNIDLMPPPLVRNIQQRSLFIGIGAAVLAIIGLFVNADEFFHAYLTAYMAWLGVTMGCMAMLMIIHLTGGAWGIVIRRMLEAGMRTLPYVAVLFIPIILGYRHIYAWARPDLYAKNEHVTELTHGYLSLPNWIWRAVVYFALFLVFAYFLNRYSAEQDRPPDRDRSPLFRMLAGPGLVVYAFAMSFAVIDWVMSITPPWISTIYPLIFVAGQCLSAMCFMVIVEAILARRSPMVLLLKPKEVQDHGKLILTWIMLWAYFSFSQLLITWAGDLPDEISWYTRRLYHGWQWIGLALVLLHFAIPFSLLLSRPFKRRTESMIWLAAWLMVMRYVDLFWFIEPNYHQSINGSWQFFVMPFAIGGFWLWLYFRNLQSRPLLALHDPNSHSVLEAAHE